MALTNFIPWPTQTATRVTVIAALRRSAGLGTTTAAAGAFDARDEQVERAARAVIARIEQYASGAPDDVKNEALLRAVAWQLDTRGATRVSSLQGAGSLEPAPSASGAWFTSSGARSLLAPWRTRNVGTIKTTA